MKKLFLQLLISLVAFSFNSCSSSDDEDNDNDTTDKVKVTVICMENINGVDSPLKGTIYFFKVPAYLKGWDYNRKNHTFTLKDGTIIHSNHSLNIPESGSQEGYLDANSFYMHVWEPSDSETVFGVESIETKDKSVTIYKKYGYIPEVPETPEEPVYGLARFSVMAIDWNKANEVEPGLMPYINGMVYFFEVTEEPKKISFYKEVNSIVIEGKSPIKASYTAEVKTSEPCVTIVKAPMKYIVVFSAEGYYDYGFFDIRNDDSTGTNFIFPKN